MLTRKSRLKSVSMISSVHSLGWSGKEAGFGLQTFRAQVKKFNVSSFILLFSSSGYRLLPRAPEIQLRKGRKCVEIPMSDREKLPSAKLALYSPHIQKSKGVHFTAPGQRSNSFRASHRSPLISASVRRSVLLESSTSCLTASPPSSRPLPFERLLFQLPPSQQQPFRPPPNEPSPAHTPPCMPIRYPATEI